MPPTQPRAEPSASIGAREAGAAPVMKSAPDPATAAAPGSRK